MAETNAYKTLYQGFLTNVEATIGAAIASGKGWIVKLITITNTDSVTRTYTLHKNGTTDAYLIAPVLSTLGAGETDVFDETHGMAATEFFSGLASVTNKLAICISGDEVSGV